MITIVESGGANIASILFALNRLGVNAQLSHDAKQIQKSSHVILPGVGSAGTAMAKLQQYNLLPTLRALTQPVLGICLGMQLLFDYSTEGEVSCLQIIPGKVKKISATAGLSVPHMGWNTFTLCQPQSLLNNIPQTAYVYFVHSYAAPVNEYTAATACHGESFAAVVQNKNFYGVQFHPERSGKWGTKILKNFLEL